MKRLLQTNSFLLSCAACCRREALLKKRFLHSLTTVTLHVVLSATLDMVAARSLVKVAIPHSRGGNELTKFKLKGLKLNIKSSPICTFKNHLHTFCLLYTSPSPRDRTRSR